MFNPSNHPPAPPQPITNLLTVESSTVTPRTPEILNTLIAMTNPMDSYNSSNLDNPALVTNDSSNSSSQDSPTSPPSVQKTCTQLIKAGLKLSIQSKRKLSSGGATGGDDCNKCDNYLDLDVTTAAKRRRIAPPVKGEITTGSEDEYDTSSMISPALGLTPEDEERRRRRRERNKIAATKCRLKKREKTVNLVQESETLETQNIKLKSEIQQLQTQRQRLSDMLSMHSPTCVKPETYQQQPYSTETETTTLPSLRPGSTGSYRPESVDYYQDPFADTKPVIIVSEDTYVNQSSFTDLDSPNSPYQYNNCHNYEQNNYSGCLA